MERQIDDLVANPHRHFNSPVEVLKDDEISTADKRRILESWKLDASRLAESTAENMSGGEESELREVSKTLLQLDEMKDTPTVVTRAEPRARKGVGLGLAIVKWIAEAHEGNVDCRSTPGKGSEFTVTLPV